MIVAYIWILVLVRVPGIEIPQSTDRPWELTESSVVFEREEDCEKIRYKYYRDRPETALSNPRKKYACKKIIFGVPKYTPRK